MSAFYSFLSLQLFPHLTSLPRNSKLLNEAQIFLHPCLIVSWCTAVWKAKHPDRLLPPMLRGHTSAASQIRQPTTSGCTALPAEFFCPTHFLCGRPVGLELIARVPERPGHPQRVSENSWKRFCLRRTKAYSALEVLWQCAIQIHITLHSQSVSRQPQFRTGRLCWSTFLLLVCPC